MTHGTIVVVDDDPLTRKVVRATLKSDGYDVLEAEDGRSALGVIAGSSPDLVLQDLVLPDVDGLDLIKQIRALPSASGIPVLAFSAFPSKLEDARSLRGGFTDYILKPIEPSRLLETIQAYTMDEREVRDRPGHGGHILIVDDDPLQRKLLKIHLEQLGFAVATAEDGLEGLDRARASPPDAIVSDMLLPHLDGFKFCLAVRQDPRLAHIPVVLTSAVFVQEADRQLAESVGASAFMERTPDQREVIELLVAVLGKPPQAPGTRPAELPSAAYTDRISSQLSKQIIISSELSRRIEWLEAKLAILGGLAETTLRSTPAAIVLDDILRRALDSTGARKGLAYLVDGDGHLDLRAEIGYTSGLSPETREFFGCLDLLQGVVDRREPIEVVSSPGLAPNAAQLLARSGTSAMFLVPLTHSSDEALGVMALEWSGDNSVAEKQFITATVTRQVSQAIELIRAMDKQKRAEEERAQLLLDEQKARAAAEAAQTRFASLYQEVQKLNEALRHRASELEAVNLELEAFSYSISHDLRAPLRAISGYSNIVLEDNGSQLPAEAQANLRRVCKNAEYMGRLIDGLLAFARLGRQPIDKQPVQPATLARDALQSAQSEWEGRCVEIEIGEMPAARADPILLRQVFADLLDNALKFTRDREGAIIEVGCLREGDEHVYFVRDNGVGFDMEFAHKLFGVFQRLHRAEEYEGTGVGLALVQRIIHRHGGRIWAEAKLNEGATFYFTLGESAG